MAMRCDNLWSLPVKKILQRFMQHTRKQPGTVKDYWNAEFLGTFEPELFQTISGKLLRSLFKNERIN